jgi:hypothetical protein
MDSLIEQSMPLPPDSSPHFSAVYIPTARSKLSRRQCRWFGQQVQSHPEPNWPIGILIIGIGMIVALQPTCRVSALCGYSFGLLVDHIVRRQHT